MPPSHRKSCLACVQSKRKCNKGLPKCQRCLTKNIDCEYNGRHPGRLRETTGRIVDENIAFVEPFPSELFSDWQLQRSPALPTTSILSPHTNDVLFNFANDPFDFESIPQGGFLSSAVIGDTVAQQDQNDVGRIISDTTAQARVDFAAKKLAMVPKIFSQQGQTMFIHRILVQDRSPPVLQDALSACALYSLKNTENQVLVFRNLEHKRQQLIANIDPLLATKTDLLEALQALILYQIMSLFDGDIRLRAQAEVDEPVLLTWANHLMLRTHQVQPPSAPAEAQHLLGSTFTDWRRWLIEESSRRTVITAFMLKGVYSFLKLGRDTVPDLRMSFTAQTALWNSQSEISWQRAQNEREWLELWVTHWDEAVGKAKPGDLEELGILIMVMLKGIVATGKWLGHSHNIRYGLEGPESDSI
ncbi:transcription factor gsfR2 [Penicillium hordei]|uniref:Transcription factor gsfR2 n=1 Tax=Penicillium hordei TaxID=40994 RepID=A0AAD6EEM8_9EURO|nr:transcription factor gsfR2 [Penicillium hordei]KAJ5615192.1 transcription factor gsfR2 [Penicillium hordei]